MVESNSELEQAKQYLWNAVKSNNWQSVQVILGHNFPINDRLNTMGLTAIHLAAANSSVNMVSVIIGFKADINKGDSMGRRALHYAAAASNN